MITHRFRCGGVASWKNVPDNPVTIAAIIKCSKCIRPLPDVPDHWCPAEDKNYTLRDRNGTIVERRKK